MIVFFQVLIGLVVVGSAVMVWRGTRSVLFTGLTIVLLLALLIAPAIVVSSQSSKQSCSAKTGVCHS